MNLLRTIRRVLAPAAAPFEWVDPGRLVDRELELVIPQERWIQEMLTSTSDPLTMAADPEQAATSRDSLLAFLHSAPGGHEPGASRRHRAPSYHFWMRLHPDSDPPVPMAGTIGLRIGKDDEILLYFGHIGYNVFPPARGRHYAERACRLLFSLARRYDLAPLWITTDPLNAASRRTCERLGGVLVDIVDIPEGHTLQTHGQTQKCRYRIDL